MSKPVAILFADSHLQDRAWSGRPIEGDAYYAFEQLVDITLANNVGYIIGAGDLIDKQHNRSSPIVFLSQQLGRLYENNVVFQFIQGQHELEDQPWFNTFIGTDHINRKTVYVGGLKVYALDYHTSEQLPEALSTIPADTDLLICHQPWAEFLGPLAASTGALSDIPHVKTVFTGDYHHHKKIQLPAASGQLLTVYSPGSTCMQAIDEPQKKYCMLLHDDLTLTKIPLKSRPVFEPSILHTVLDLDRVAEELEGQLKSLKATALADGIPEHIAKPLLYVTYSHAIAKDVRLRIPKIVGDLAFPFWKELPKQDEEMVERRREMKERGEIKASTLQSELVSFLQTKGFSDYQSDCEFLLSSPDPAAAIRHLKTQALT